MSVLQIRLPDESLKTALAAEAEALGLTSAEVARRVLSNGVEALRLEREKAEWIAAADPAIAEQDRWFDNRDHPFAAIMPLSGDAAS